MPHCGRPAACLWPNKPTHTPDPLTAAQQPGFASSGHAASEPHYKLRTPTHYTHSLSSFQAEAANVINTVASAAEGYPFVPPEWAPAVFTPLVGLVLPAIGMATLFVYM